MPVATVRKQIRSASTSAQVIEITRQAMQSLPLHKQRLLMETLLEDMAALQQVGVKQDTKPLKFLEHAVATLQAAGVRL